MLYFPQKEAHPAGKCGYTKKRIEKGYGASKAKLQKLIRVEEVRVDTVARDKYGRPVTNLYKGHKSVNKKMKTH